MWQNEYGVLDNLKRDYLCGDDIHIHIKTKFDVYVNGVQSREEEVKKRKMDDYESELDKKKEDEQSFLDESDSE